MTRKKERNRLKIIEGNEQRRNKAGEREESTKEKQKGNTREGIQGDYLSDDIFFAGIELGALVDVGSAGVAANAHGEHHANLDLLVLRLPPPRDLRRIEVRRIVLV